jgi:hypothetical protein
MLQQLGLPHNGGQKVEVVAEAAAAAAKKAAG